MSGQLYWITGLSGAGKSSLAQRLFKMMKPKHPTLVLLDGDEMRETLNLNGQYEVSQRYEASMTYSRLCQLLTSQGIDVICATISMFDDVRNQNRKCIPEYTEIYLEVPLSVLKQRNHLGLYRGRPEQKVPNVVGCDIDPQIPKNPDILLRNDGGKTVEALTDELLKKL